MGMQEARDYMRSLERSRTALTRKDRPSVFTMYGREWDLFPEVFAPIYSLGDRNFHGFPRAVGIRGSAVHRFAVGDRMWHGRHRGLGRAGRL
ncbi:hypothetical protein GCM10020000_19710 [Streptomyces olivoverticillatus]